MTDMVRGTEHQAQAAVLAESRLLRTLFDQLPALIAYWDADLRNVVANEAYVEWFGLTPEQVRGIHIRDVLGEEVYAKNLPHILGALAGQEQLFDRTLVDQAGRVRHTQASYVPDLVDGQVNGFFVLVTDVTPRVEAQRAMDEAQSIARVGSYSYSLADETVTWSEELFRLFGLDPATFRPSVDAVFAKVHEDDLAYVEQVLASARTQGAPYSAHYRIRRPDGSIREVESRGRPITNSAGTVVRLTGTIQDVTEANEGARELERTNADLRQMNRLNADVLSMLGHDVRAPLGVVLGYLEYLDEGWESATEQQRRDFVATARRSATRLRGLVDDILTLATVDAGTITPRVSDIDARSLIREVLDEVSGGDTFVITGDPDAQAVLSADPFHVRQILANLVSNALRYGAAPFEIQLAVPPGAVEISVRDNGPGVPEEFVPRLFQRFSSHPDVQTGIKGRSTGFGLYMAARLAEANGGTLTYSAAGDGTGAVFTLRVPRAAA